MIHSSGDYAIVFNGEIYNFRELFEKYCPNDGSVNGRSDTSVLLDLYARYGKECLSLLNGMFAFAIVHLRSREVFLARDRFGEKPLYWLCENGLFAFGSELKALRVAFPERQWRLSTSSFARYQVLGSVPAPDTIYRGIAAVTPGGWVQFSNRVVVGRYWSLAETYDNQHRNAAPSYDEALGFTRSKLLDATRSRLISDVPVGLFLSGGLDSGALMGLCEAAGEPQRHAVCIDFAEAAFSEYKVANATAEHYGSSALRVEVGLSDFQDSIAQYFAAMDQPSCDGYNTFFVCKAAKQLGVKAWLSGVGGDELFGGYRLFSRFSKLALASRLAQRAIPQALVNDIAPSLLPILRVSRMLHMADPGLPEHRAHQALRAIMPWRNIRSLTRDLVLQHLALPEVLDEIYPPSLSRFDAYQWASVFESGVYMASQLLRDMDNFSMAHSLELRAPFLDHRLFEYVFSLPSKFKRANGTPKPLLARSLPKQLPELVLRQPKRGFTFPLEVWLRKGLTPSLEDMLGSKGVRDLWDTNYLARLLQHYRNGRIHWGVVWNLYAFARWRELNPCTL